MWIRVRRRLTDAFLVSWVVATLCFVLLHLAPGDPMAASVTDPRIAPAVRAHWRAVYAFDQPLHEQYRRYIVALSRGDLGYSTSQHRDVRQVLGDALPYSLALIGISLIASIALAIGVGVWQGVRVGSRADRTVSLLASAVASVPDFWLALMLLSLFGAQLKLLPLNGTCDPLTCTSERGVAALADLAKHALLPVLTLTLLLTASFARVERVAIVNLLNDDAVRTAFAKGASRRRVLWRHAVPRALRPLLTVAGLSLPLLVGGALFVERVFGWPGMGAVLLDAINGRDYPLVTSIAMLGCVMVVFGAFLTDVASELLDPATRTHRHVGEASTRENIIGERDAADGIAVHESAPSHA